MKKLIIIILSLFLVTGCGMSNKEKENLLYTSLEKAYKVIYATDGVGLAVYNEDIISVDNKVWYKVAISEFNSLSKLTNLVDDVFDEKLKANINNRIEERYFQTDTELYSTAEGGCNLGYELDENLLDNIKSNAKVKKINFNKIVFEYNGKEYTAKKSKDNYIFDNKIFTCKEV